MRKLPYFAWLIAALIPASCDRPAEPASPGTVEAAPPAPATPTPDVVPQRLGRADLLAAVEQAASDYAAGKARDGADPLTGRAFVLDLAFGCNGPTPADAATDGLPGWSWGRDRKAIEISLAPAAWTDSPLVGGASGDGWEAVEGFWIARPWMRADGCPGAAVEAPAAPTIGSPQTVGLAAVFEADGSRLGRRNGRAYRHTIRPVEAATVSATEGYRLRLEGRFASFADGGAVRCQAASTARRPVCVAAAQLDRVAFTTASGEILSEWRPD
ncbi:hypothetical protein GGR12_001696 [Brevundimonas lenta]|uniref:Uncharacterized protein n=1 Tax=Brevundimonas lenta TaxID=424796 RepID=A0A7W6NNX8_9CAUL|nr:hypothetical protein [Brevundimonas lenta]